MQEISISACVKNGFYDLTKEQIVVIARKGFTNDCQGKALEEGCCKREWARMSVPSREKTNTKKNLVKEH